MGFTWKCDESKAKQSKAKLLQQVENMNARHSLSTRPKQLWCQDSTSGRVLLLMAGMNAQTLPWVSHTPVQFTAIFKILNVPRLISQTQESRGLALLVVTMTHMFASHGSGFITIPSEAQRRPSVQRRVYFHTGRIALRGGKRQGGLVRNAVHWQRFRDNLNFKLKSHGYHVQESNLM